MRKNRTDLTIPITLTKTESQEHDIPPRLIVPGASIWFKPESVEIDEDVFIQQTGRGSCIYDTTQQTQLHVNGQPLMGRRILKDGDFIHNNSDVRVIFQQNPVSDHFAAFEDSDNETSVDIKLSKRLQENVKMDALGISLDAGNTKVKWLELTNIWLYCEHTSSKWAIELLSDHAEKIPSKFKNATLTGEEMQSLYTWLMYTCPYDLSLQWFARADFSDAYKIIAWEKLLIPAYEGKLLISASPAKILGLPTHAQAYRQLFTTFAYALIPTIVITALIVFYLPINIHALIVLVFTYLGVLLLGRKRLLSEFELLRNLHKYESLEEFRKIPAEWD